MRLPSISMGCFIFLMKSSGLSFWNSGHSVTIIQQFAFLMHSIADAGVLDFVFKDDFCSCCGDWVVGNYVGAFF